METQLQQIFEMQDKLDDKIIRQHGLMGKDLRPNKVLALLVEIGELANETRCFKHWSTKGPSAKEVIAEEFADGLHFFVSLAIDYQMEPKDLIGNISDLTGETLQESFLKLYEVVTNIFVMDFSPFEIQDAFSLYIGIADKFLDLSWDDIVQAYMRKNSINHDRQAQGY